MDSHFKTNRGKKTYIHFSKWKRILGCPLLMWPCKTNWPFFWQASKYEQNPNTREQLDRTVKKLQKTGCKLVFGGRELKIWRPESYSCMVVFGVPWETMHRSHRTRSHNQHFGLLCPKQMVYSLCRLACKRSEARRSKVQKISHMTSKFQLKNGIYHPKIMEWVNR